MQPDRGSKHGKICWADKISWWQLTPGPEEIESTLHTAPAAITEPSQRKAEATHTRSLSR
jgi:hypothetical protein